MAYNIACIKGRLGSTEYYLGTMKAEEIVGMAKPASRLEEWEAFDSEGTDAKGTQRKEG